MINMLGRLKTVLFSWKEGVVLETLQYRVIRSSRKTMAIQITAEGEVLVRCPLRVSSGQIREFVSSKSGWITAHLAKLASLPRHPALTAAQLHRLAEEARQVFPARVAVYAPLVGVTWGSITVRTQKTRWGSCSSGGNLSFNCLLMLAPEHVLDYVVVHELCHRREMNHSQRFWAEVERVLPKYREAKVWLKENGTGLMSRIPSGQKR